LSQVDGRAKAWLRARVRLAPGALGRQRGPSGNRFDHEWAPALILAQHIRALPPMLWEVLLSLESGFVILVAGRSRYMPGTLSFRRRQLRNVAFVSLGDLVGPGAHIVREEPAGIDSSTWAPLHVMGHLIDHHLGCAGEEQGAWLSDGGGATFAWRAAGSRLGRLFGLGYGIDEVARSNVRDYFAQSLAAYCCNRQALNAADPQISKWLRTTLWNGAFWRQGVRDRAG
jgi:hypothetical protein